MSGTEPGLSGEKAVGGGIGPKKILGFVVAVLGIQLAFIASYVTAFHAPSPQHIRVAVVAPADVRTRVAAQLNSITGSPLAASPANSDEAALAALQAGDTSAVFTVDENGNTDTLTVASAGGSSVAAAAQRVFEQVEKATGRTVTITDAVPAQSGDGRGLTGFYMVTGWLVGGYLLAAVLGILLGAKLTGAKEAAARMGIFVPYAVLGGIGGALIVDQGLSAMTRHFWAVAGVGALVVMSSAMVTLALQSLFGIIGIGITILLFVVLGNPSAGGAYQAELLPPLWRALSSALPNGAGTTALRGIVYFDGHRVTGSFVLIAVYAVAGIAVTLLASVRRGRRIA